MPAPSTPQSIAHGSQGEVDDPVPALHSHAAFFSPREDGLISPLDTFDGFRRLDYNLIFCFLGMVIIHQGFWLVASPKYFGIVPDPFFRLQVNKMHKAKHGSDTESYDKKGRFDPSRFDEAFETYTRAPHDSMSARETVSLIRGQTDVFDFFGWFAACFEWFATYLLLWPADGRMKKEDVKGIYDGSTFWRMEEKRKKRLAAAGRK